MIDLSYDIKNMGEVSFILSQFTCLTDKRTDERTDISLVANTALRNVHRGKTLLVETSMHVR